MNFFSSWGYKGVKRLVNNPNIANQLPDESLMKLAHDGQSWAFETLYDRYAGKLLRYVFRFVNDQAQAQDLVQETFLKLIEKPEAFDTGKRFSTWLYTVAGNLCRNHLRNIGNRKRINESLRMDDAGEMPKSTMDLKRLQSAIQSVFGTLSEKEQEVFVLRFELDMSMKEMAEVLGIPEGSVKSRLFYLLKKIAPQLNEFRHG